MTDVAALGHLPVMAKISGSDIRSGTAREHNGSLRAAVKPGKGPAYNQVDLKNIFDGCRLKRAD